MCNVKCYDCMDEDKLYIDHGRPYHGKDSKVECKLVFPSLKHVYEYYNIVMSKVAYVRGNNTGPNRKLNDVNPINIMKKKKFAKY